MKSNFQIMSPYLVPIVSCVRFTEVFSSSDSWAIFEYPDGTYDEIMLPDDDNVLPYVLQLIYKMRRGNKRARDILNNNFAKYMRNVGLVFDMKVK